MTVDTHVQALRDALVNEHESHIAEILDRSEQAAARGDAYYHRFYQDHAAELRAMVYPWDRASEDA